MTTAPTLTPAAFAQKWRGVTTTEKASAQEHFIDLCRMLGQPTPHEADPTGESYAFERRVEKAGGGDGFADVWKRDFFAWEYKGHRKDLKKLDTFLRAALTDPSSPEIKYIRKRLQDQGVEATPDQLASWVKARLDAKEPSNQGSMQPVGFSSSVTKASESAPTAGYGKTLTGSEPEYWLIPAGNRAGIKAIDYLKMWLARGYWALGEHTPGRKAIKSGDRACFYAAGLYQVVAYADVADAVGAPVSPEEWPEPKPQSDVLYKMPLANITWLTPPTPLDQKLRGQLDALAGRDPAGNWGLFFQTSRRLTLDDFKRLTRT